MQRQETALKTFVALKRTTDAFTKHVKEDIKCHGLNVTEFAVLEVLYSKGPQAIQNIKEKILIASSSTTYVIDCLEKKELVKRIKSQEDKRSYQVDLTKKGYELIDSIFPPHADMIEACFEDLDDDELLALKDSLKIVSSRLSNMDDE